MDLLRITYFLLLVSLFSCKKDEDRVQLKYELNAYHTIQLNDAFEVELIEQEKYEIEILGLESFAKKTVFSVQDCTLSIRNDKKYKWTDPSDNTVKLIIKGKGLKKVSANESCIIKSLNAITTKEFGIILASKANTADIILENKVCYYWNNFPCGGKLTLRGKTDELKIWNYAIMTVDASALQAKTGIVENSSKGDCTINISERLEYKIDGEGDIILYGDPDTKDNGSSNSGTLIKR
jgi:hypothetical protein